MKLPLSLFLALSIPFSTFAWPTVGDRAVYVGTHTENNVTSPTEVTVFMASYDSAKKQFVQHVVTRIGQNTVMKSVATDQDLVPSPKNMTALMSSCALRNGMQTMTVRAGTFSTCLLHQTYLAKVPFGMIRYKGQGYDIELSEFTNGKELE